MRKSRLIGALMLSLAVPVSMGAEPAAPEGQRESQSAQRTILHRQDVPGSNHEVLMVLVEVPAHTKVAKHTHPGTVVGYVVEGDYTIAIEGRPARWLQTHEMLEVPSGAVHEEYTTDKPAKLLAVFTVEKGKPLTVPVEP